MGAASSVRDRTGLFLTDFFITQSYNAHVLHPYLSSAMTNILMSLDGLEKKAFLDFVCSDGAKILPKKGAIAPFPALFQASEWSNISSPAYGLQMSALKDLQVSSQDTLEPHLVDLFVRTSEARMQGKIDSSIRILESELEKGRSHLSDFGLASLFTEMGLNYQAKKELVRAVEWYNQAVQTKPGHNEACVLFARMFMGRESPFALAGEEVKREVFAMLGRSLTLFQADLIWSELLLYAIGASHFYLNELNAAAAVYDRIVSKPKPLSAVRVVIISCISVFK